MAKNEKIINGTKYKVITAVTGHKINSAYLKPTPLYTLPLNQINAGTLQATINKIHKNGCPASALNSIRKTLKRFYKYLVQNGLAPFNFVDTLTVPKKKRKQGSDIVVWSDEELRKILDSFDKAQNGFRLRFLMVMGAYTGMRISELLGLKYSDIKETENGYIVEVQRQVKNLEIFDTDGTKINKMAVTELKTSCSYRTIPLPLCVIDELKIHRAWHRKEQMRNGYRTDFIFTTNTGGFIDAKNTRVACNRYYKNIGVPAKGFHTYRHTFGTNLYKNGVPIVTASRLLGHEDISTTQKYYINTPEEDKRRAVELLARVI